MMGAASRPCRGPVRPSTCGTGAGEACPCSPLNRELGRRFARAEGGLRPLSRPRVGRPTGRGQPSARCFELYPESQRVPAVRHVALQPFRPLGGSGHHPPPTSASSRFEPRLKKVSSPVVVDPLSRPVPLYDNLPFHTSLSATWPQFCC